MRQFATPQAAAQWLAERASGGQLRSDSRQVRPGDAFIAWPGAATDGRHHVRAALAQGAAACLVEAEGVDDFGFDAEGDAVAAYPGLKTACGPIASAWFGEPSAALDVLAITGTNGKTSTAWWLAQALSKARPNAGCGVIGTLGVGRPPQVEPNGLTTPDPVLLQSWLRRFVDQGLSACAIEASSIGLAERRLDATHIRVAVFTNFTRDHLDYHADMATYWAAKAELFAWPGLRSAVVNVDDEHGAALAARLQQRGAIDLWTVSCHDLPSDAPARLRAESIEHAEAGLAFTVVEGDERHALRTPLVGDYNVSNLLGVIATLRALELPLAQAVRACDSVLPVPGRMEVLRMPGQPLVAIDYAHTPDALDKVLAALRPLAQARAGQLWCVFGCGGNRDATKRPLMAAIAEKQADRVVVTSDNPRNEKPEVIISQILRGLSHDRSVEVQADRARAIASTIAAASAADVILVAGKGHEAYQEVAGTRQPFDDRVHARHALARRAAA